MLLREMDAEEMLDFTPDPTLERPEKKAELQADIHPVGLDVDRAVRSRPSEVEGVLPPFVACAVTVRQFTGGLGDRRAGF